MRINDPVISSGKYIDPEYEAMYGEPVVKLIYDWLYHRWLWIECIDIGNHGERNQSEYHIELQRRKTL